MDIGMLSAPAAVVEIRLVCMATIIPHGNGQV